MVSEKRFIVESVMIDCLCEDEPRIAKVITDTDENYSYEDLYEVAELLNEQQATIQSLKEENEKLRFLIDINSVSERKKLERQVDEQQATIRKLQDLCGESDSENAKLRIENKKLKEELNDCEKFRYTVFKRLNKEYIKERSIQ